MHLQDFHRIQVRNDSATGLRAVIAIHNLSLGPALGGVRRWAYADDAAALADAVNLARGMTRKNALAELPFGGGKSVIIAPPKGKAPGPAKRLPTEPELLQFGRWVAELGGEYVAAEDVGMRVADLAVIGQATDCVTGIGRDGRGGNPGPKTALGVLIGIRVAAERLGHSNLRGLKVAVQGLGNVGMTLCEELHQAGAQLLVADLNPDQLAEAQRRFGAAALPVAEILQADADIIAPCALGGILTPELAQTLRARAIVGSANNQLASPEAATALRQRGILYAPDYVVNAGGVISAASEYLGQDGDEAQILKIGPRLKRIFDQSDATGEPESVVADRMAQEALERPRLSQVA